MAYSTNTNTRVFYATQGVVVGDFKATSIVDSWQAGDSYLDGDGKLMIAHGLQSIGVTTNFNLEQIFELGQLSLYENFEEVPEIEVTFEKVLDGYSLIYHLGTVDATNPTLTGRSEARADVRMAIGLTADTSIQSGNSGVAELYCSGMYINAVSYNLATDGNFTESTTFVGNDKQWYSGSENGILVSAKAIISAFTTSIFGNDAPVSPDNSVLRRQNVVIGSAGLGMASGTFRTVVPDFIEGTTTGATGVTDALNGNGLNSNCSYIDDSDANKVHLNSASISVDFGRESINELGSKAPYARYVSFPVDVTCDIEVTAIGGDNIDAAEEAKNLSDHSIQFVLDDSTVLQLGNKNKLTSVTYGGGDAGGGNATISYSMTNSNDFVVLHSGDPISISGTSYFKSWF
jgi:hypothetical protein